MRIVEIRFDLGEVQGIGANKDRDGVLLPMIPEIGLALENQRSILITILGEAINDGCFKIREDRLHFGWPHFAGSINSRTDDVNTRLSNQHAPG